MRSADTTDRNPCRSSTLRRSERRAVRQRLSAYRRILDRPRPEGSWEVLTVPWNDPSRPCPTAPVLAHRVDDGDLAAVQMWGEDGK